MKKFYSDYIKYNTPFFVLATISILMLVISWIMPPPWQIHSSVIQGVAEIFAIMALWTIHTAVVKGRSATLKKGDIELHIKDEKQEEDQQ